jgi:hypothetical protein
MNKALAAAAAAVLALGLSSCGGGDDDAQASRALSDSIMKSQSSGGDPASSLLSLKKKDADCIGKGLVDEIGTDQLRAYKLLTDDNLASKSVTDVKMSKHDAAAATDVFFGCIDVPAKVQKVVASSGQVPAAIQACVTKALDDETLRSVFTQIFAGNQDAAQQRLVDPVSKCAAPSGG